MDSIYKTDGSQRIDKDADVYYGYKFISLEFKDNTAILSGFYSFQIAGRYSLLGGRDIFISVKELVEKSIIPQLAWQPAVVEYLNKSTGYEIKGNGSHGSNLKLFSDKRQWAICLTKD